MRADIRASLHQAMLPRFKYPRRAVRRGWEGVVRIRLDVDADGRINNLRIVESSGHGILDRNALKTLKKFKRIPGIPKRRLEGQGLHIVLPVVYRLTRS